MPIKITYECKNVDSVPRGIVSKIKSTDYTTT